MNTDVDNQIKMFRFQPEMRSKFKQLLPYNKQQIFEENKY